jgi:chromosome segregation ATPase
MDMQQSSAPLMRQLESAERQNRNRANAWAELENRLRNENEELNTAKDSLMKEKNELVMNVKRLERYLKEKDDECLKAKQDLEDVKNKSTGLETKVDGLQQQLAASNKDHSEMIKSLKDHEGKIRTDMTKLLRENEVKYQNEIEMERQTRSRLERKIEELLSLYNSAQLNVATPLDHVRAQSQKLSKPKLTSKDDQASILQSALIGLSVEEDDDLNWIDEAEELKTTVAANSMATASSYAYTEQLLQGMKVAKLELETLRSQFNDSEATKENLLKELSRCKDAGDRLPALEKDLKILEAQLREKNLEVKGLREDIAEVRLLYRSQLDALLEEKALATSTSPSSYKIKANTTFESLGSSFEKNMIYGADDVTINLVN